MRIKACYLKMGSNMWTSTGTKAWVTLTSLVRYVSHITLFISHSVAHCLYGKTHPIPSNRGNGTDQWSLSSFTNTTFHDFYHPLFEIDEFMEHLAAMYPDNVTIYELGHSGEGREMYAMRISRGSQQDGDKPRIEKKAFVVTGAQHAREASPFRIRPYISSLITIYYFMR